MMMMTPTVSTLVTTTPIIPPLLSVTDWAICLLVGYVIGSLPFGYWLPKWFQGVDIREHGSGNTGGTNVLRTCGKPLGIATYALDFFKAFIPVYILREGFPSESLLHVAFGLTIIIGHAKTFLLNFKGGKSAISTLGCLFAFSPLGGLVCAVLAVALMRITRIVSIGSMVTAAVAWAILWFFKAPLPYVLFTAVAGVLVIYLHKANIARLLAGTENKF
jgi:glycerol-3-phosphate acyltransferase PlsY